MKRDPDPRESAGRALYQERHRFLSGLGQPDAPDWEDLDEAVRERWRGHAVPREEPRREGHACGGSSRWRG